MSILDEMKLFMEPKSIALIGVSRSTEGAIFSPLGNLLSYGYAGSIYPVNPSAEQILGVKAYPSIKDLPDNVDLTVILTPRDTVPGVLKECVDNGLRTIIVVAQGFADSDDEGKALQSEMVNIIKEGRARLIGPNTFGVTNAFLDMSTALAKMELERTPIGIISQTGVPFLGTSRFKFGKVIDVGDTCDVDVSDALEYLDNDPQTSVVVLQIEGVQDGMRFKEVVSRVVKNKPVLALKAGRTKAGARAAQSHTGSMVGRDEVYDAMFKQCGVIRLDDIEEMEDLSLAFAQLPPMKGRGVTVMSWAGSTGVLSVDACEENGLVAPSLSTSTVSRIRELAPPDWLPVDNPVDLWACVGLSGFNPKNFKSAFRTILDALLNEDSSDAVVVIIPDYLELFPSDDWDISGVVLEAVENHRDRPIVFSILGPWGKLTEKLEQNKNVVVFRSCERAIRALSRLQEYYARRET